jgi:hypothetical protein
MLGRKSQSSEIADWRSRACCARRTSTLSPRRTIAPDRRACAQTGGETVACQTTPTEAPPGWDGRIAAWADVFEGGYAYFHDFTEATGLATTDIHGVWAAAPEAWKRLGRAFLAARTPTDPQPWGLEQFGAP